MGLAVVRTMRSSSPDCLSKSNRTAMPPGLVACSTSQSTPLTSCGAAVPTACRNPTAPRCRRAWSLAARRNPRRRPHAEQQSRLLVEIQPHRDAAGPGRLQHVAIHAVDLFGTAATQLRENLLPAQSQGEFGVEPAAAAVR